MDIGYASTRDGFNGDAAFMAFKAGPPTRVIGHNTISLDAHGKPVAAWLLDGTELNLDGDAIPRQRAASAITP